MIKHSVLTLTYNQEKYIQIALDSILNQSVLPDEIIISDDCSTDKTWDIILKYFNKFPKIIKPFRNEKNLGIFQNYNKAIQHLTGNIISSCAGDDYLKPGLFKHLNEIIYTNKLDPYDEKFIIITNTEHLYPNGKTVIFNNYRIRNHDLFKQRLRYGLSYRGIGFSRKLFFSSTDHRTDLGPYGDWLRDFDQVLQSDRFIFTDFVSVVYRVGVGIVAKTTYKDMKLSHLKALDELQKKYYSRFDQQDLEYIAFLKTLDRYLLEENIHQYVKLFLSFFKNINNFSINNRYPVKILIPISIRKKIMKLKKFCKNCIFSHLCKIIYSFTI